MRVGVDNILGREQIFALAPDPSIKPLASSGFPRVHNGVVQIVPALASLKVGFAWRTLLREPDDDDILSWNSLNHPSDPMPYAKHLRFGESLSTHLNFKLMHYPIAMARVRLKRASQGLALELPERHLLVHLGDVCRHPIALLPEGLERRLQARLMPEGSEQVGEAPEALALKQ